MLTSREQARVDISNYIEMFYSVKRTHGTDNLVSPIDFEGQYRKQLDSA
jgi:putative transposase